MKKMMVLGKNEIREIILSPAIAVIILPIFMSKVIGYAMESAGVEFLLLSVWILFAEVMVGIMLTGPNLIEEREGKTLDALLVTPLNFAQIAVSKGLTILLFSMLSQIFVFIINRGFDGRLLSLLIPMFLGGLLFVEIGMVLGLIVNSSKNGSAISAAVMVVLFLIVSIYLSLPEWTYKFLVFLPSIEVTEVISNIMDGNGVPVLEAILMGAWILVLTSWISIIGKKRY